MQHLTLPRRTIVVLACVWLLPYVAYGQHSALDLGPSAAEPRKIYPGPSAEYLNQLLESECGEVGTGVEIGKYPTAISGAYLTATAVFPDAPPTDPADYVRIAVDTVAYEAMLGYFRVRNPTADSASIWARVNDRAWRRYTFPPNTDWTWQQGAPRLQSLIIGSQENDYGTIDVAFASAGLQLDQLYLENLEYDRAYPIGNPIRPFAYKLKGTNCPDFVNLPPVAGIEPGREVYAVERYIEAEGSYDPNDIVACYNHQYVGERDRCLYGGYMIPPLGDNSIYVVVRDYYGATDTATAIFRGVPFSYTLSERTAYRLEGECGVTDGGYWTAEADADRYNGSLAVGGTAASYTGPPADVPENQLRFTIPDVAEADTGRYYLAGVFEGAPEEDNCVWVRINGGEWNEWTIISPERSFYPGPPFNLVEGDNTLELAYCSPGLGVDRLFVSPDTGYPNILTREGNTIDLGCDGEPEIGELWFEAECAEVGGAWNRYNNVDAANKSYVVSREATRYGPPVTDDAMDYVRFRVAPLVTGTYQLQARIKAPDPLSDSYYVRVNGGAWQAWRSGMRRGDEFNWNVFPGGGVQLRAGENTVDFAYREANTQLDKIYLGPATAPLEGVGKWEYVEGCYAGSTDIDRRYLDAECALYGSAWTPRSAPNAQSGGYLVALDGNALTTPPAAIPENLVTFFFEPLNTFDGKLYLSASIAAPSPDDDSFWVRFNDGSWYAWKTLKRNGRQFEWNRFPIPLRDVRRDQPNVLQFAFRESGTRLDRIFLSTLDELPEPRGRGYCRDALLEEIRTREAECTNYENAWVTVSSALASNNDYVVFTGERQLDAPTYYDTSRIQEYKIEVGAQGEYRLFIRMDAPDVTRNSIWVQLDNGPWIRMWQEVGGAQLLTKGFEWRELNEDGVALRLFLTGGDQIVRIANREPGTKIDKLYFSPEKPPFGFGPIADNCQSSNVVVNKDRIPPYPLRPASNTKGPALTLYPNPITSGELTLELVSAYTGRVQVRVYDGQGRRVLQLPVEKGGEQVTAHLQVAQLPTGVYHLQVIAGDRQTVKTFVRQ